MTGPRDSARGNGLVAGAWTILGEVDPRVVPGLLASLAEHGIAAFALPSPGSRGGYLDIRLPARPVDQLHVDASRRDEAQALLLAIGPVASASDGHAVSDEDAAFAAIVARWYDDPATPQPSGRPWPAAEDVVPEGEPRPRTAAAEANAPLETRPPVEIWRGAIDLEPGEEHFEPPDPPPIPRPKGLTLVGLIAVLSGIAVLVWTAASDTPGPDPQLGGIALLVGGTALLISRLRGRDDDNGDDGAVV